MPTRNPRLLLPGYLVRLGRRVVDGLVRRIAERRHAQSDPPQDSPMMSDDLTIRLDYPVRPRARWGRAWDLPVHSRLESIIRGQDAHARQTLAAIANYAEALRRIPVRAPEEESAPRWVNGWLPGLDGAAIYALLRERRPATYWEVGSGNSTRFARRAIADGGLPTRIVSIDPSPRVGIDALCDEVIRGRLEEVDAALLSRVAPGDVCFIDCSHRSFQNSDVTVAMIELLPALPEDVVIGFHDIFLPDDYPPEWVGRYYNEQYLLAMFLLGGHAGMQIVLPAWDASRRPELAAIVAPVWEGEAFDEVERHGDAFWLRTVSIDDRVPR